MGQETGRPDGGQHTGGGPQGERIEGTLTNGGSQPGERSFAPREPGHTSPESEGEGEGDGTMSGRGLEEGRETSGAPKSGDQDRPDADYDDRGYG